MPADPGKQTMRGGEMKLPEYVTTEEVKRVCRELKIRDWTKLREAKIPPAEARKVLARVNSSKMKIALEDFRAGLEVELEHGLQFKDANVTNNHRFLTGLIALALFMESLDYYKLLEGAELEGDLVKAVAAGNMEKVKKYYRRLAAARIALRQAELKRLGSR
jgi:hypothetical protein